jgi:hypothetical protein
MDALQGTRSAPRAGHGMRLGAVTPAPSGATRPGRAARQAASRSRSSALESRTGVSALASSRRDLTATAASAGEPRDLPSDRRVREGSVESALAKNREHATEVSSAIASCPSLLWSGTVRPSRFDRPAAATRSRGAGRDLAVARHRLAHVASAESDPISLRASVQSDAQCGFGFQRRCSGEEKWWRCASRRTSGA